MKDHTGMQVGKNGWFRTIWGWTYRQLPAWLILPGFMRQWSRPLRINTIPFAIDDIASGQVVDVELDPKLLLRKHLTVPLAAKASLSQAVDLNMRQSLPGGGGDMAWIYAIEKKEHSDLKVGIYLVKKKTLDQIEKFLGSHKVIVRTISVADNQKLKPLVDYRRATDRARRFWDAMALMLLVLSIGAVYWGEAQVRAGLQEQIRLLHQQKTDLSSKALSLRESLDNESSSNSALIRDVGRFLSEHQRLNAVLDLTEALDDGTWISELVVSGSILRLSGFTGDEVTSVMDTIRSLAWVNRVDIEGPITFDSYSRKNRFDLSITLNGTGEIEN